MSKRLPPEDGRAKLEFARTDGEAAAYLVWPPSRPGHELLRSLIPPLELVFGGTAILLGMIITSARRAGRALQDALAAQLSVQEQLVYIVQHDSLTGIANRALFLEYLE